MVGQCFLYAVVLCCVATAELSAQDVRFMAGDTAEQSAFPRYSFLSLRLQGGRLIDSGTAGLRYIERNPVNNIDVRYGIIGYGRKLWHIAHHYPVFGIGVGRYAFRPSRNILGSPWSTYVFYQEPFYTGRSSTLAYDIAVGLSYGWKAYDSLTNPEQKALGSPVNVLASLGLRYEVQLSEQLHLGVGPSISHFSNGRTRTPNRGLNLYGIQASVRYNLPSRQRNHWPKYAKHIDHGLPEFKPQWEASGAGGVGIVTTFNDINTNRDRFYRTFAISADVARQYAHTGRYGIGADWFYDGSIRQELKGDVSFGKLQYWGVHISHEYLIHRWTIVTQPGLYLGTSGDKGKWFGRIALRYDLTPRIFLRGGVRIYKSFRSDSIEASAGYTFWRRSA